ncbi:MAG: hypothetical protein WC551_06695 [Patescibacteria group bacterium]
MLNRMGKLVVGSAMLILGACAPMKSSQTAESATRGHTNCVQTSRGLECNKDTVKAFDDCMRINTQTMGSTGAYALCACVADGGSIVPSQNAAIPPTCVPTNGAGMVGGGMMPGMMGGGYGMTMMPGRYAGYPGSAVVMYPDPTPIGVIAMENAGFGGRTLPLPSSGAQPASSGPTQQDLDDLARSQAAQQAAICRARPQDPICCTSCKK